MHHPLLIAEVKTRSPFGFSRVSPRVRRDYRQAMEAEAWEEQLVLANRIGDWVAVHTHPAWGGSWRHLETARSRTGKPLLAKGIHSSNSDIDRAIDLGADFVLVVGRYDTPERHLEKVVFELGHPVDLARVPLGGRVLWNQRDLQSGFYRNITTLDVKQLNSIDWVKQPSWVLASGLKTWADVPADVPAVLVGEHLSEFARSTGD